MQQQQGGNHCGLFGVAFAVDLWFGKDPFSFHYNQEVMCDHLCDQVLWKEPASLLSTWSQDKKEDGYLVYTRWHTTLPISFHKTSTQTGRALNGWYSFTVVCTISICCNMTFMHSSCFPLHKDVLDTKQLCKLHRQTVVLHSSMVQWHYTYFTKMYSHSFLPYNIEEKSAAFTVPFPYY